MSVVEDVRTAIQDFLAPQLRELAARMDSLEKVMVAKFDAVDFKLESFNQQMNSKFEAVESKFDALSQRMNSKFEAQEANVDSLRREMNARFDAVGNQIYDLKSALDLDRRMSRLESQQASLPAKSA